MATQTHAIPLAARQPRSGLGSDLDSTRAPPALPPIPRKKQAAVLLSAFMTIALTIGYNQCYGVFQEYYLSASQDVLEPAPASRVSPPTALLAFVGTLCYGLTWAGGILVNPVISQIEHGTWDPATPSTHRLWRRRILRKLLSQRTITISGVVLIAAGFALASLSTSIWQLLLTQGFLVGLGMSMLYFPLLAPAPEYFTNHRATAMGFAGGGTGGLIFSPVIRALLSSVGGRWTLRIYAAFNLVAGLPIAWAVPKSRFAAASTAEGPERRNTHVSRALASRATFIFSAVAAFLQAAGAQLPLSFIPSYTVVLGLDASKGATLLAASNAINAVSRILTGYAGDRFGRQNTLVLTLLLAATSVFAFWLSSLLATTSSASLPLWLAFIVLYSFSAGGYYGLFPALIAEVFGIRQYAAVNAFILLVRGLGTMFGSPVGGQLLGTSDQSTAAYASIAYWDGALLMGATACCVGVRWADGKGRGWKWIA
ncbi:major facilitator superfamily domain-containing protein [Lasiosphaeria miniovina]|uniref:Major facilitator superfamily domain-containing protein n=1 Tax=Lasiosphaeria miniovina TaxID=1954250 RepID=A0AA40DMA0_9PEZI|nr:major facilitator superfamily domain-containing protein [Lasiosphaeria miniovina]KAK0706027.1 major facilitator superfamily domain-containing protein [Lasiosphaeria miniovina]